MDVRGNSRSVVADVVARLAALVRAADRWREAKHLEFGATSASGRDLGIRQVAGHDASGESDGDVDLHVAEVVLDVLGREDGLWRRLLGRRAHSSVVPRGFG